MTSLFLLDVHKEIHFLSLAAYQSGIWYLGIYFVAYCHIASEREKTRRGLSNDDVINLKAMIKRYIFSSILQVLWPVALKLRILESFMLLMTNNYKFV